MTSLIAVAMSGGVDSTMAASLIMSQGHPIVGLHFVTGYEANSPCHDADHGDDGLQHPMDSARKRMAPICDHLGISLEVIDIQNEFEKTVIQYFAKTYQSGQTPNPCMICNPNIKFGTVLKTAKRLGAERMATGHYARIVRDPDGCYHLLQGKDPQKEQSYFLARLSQKQLAAAIFPLGEMTKPEVKDLAKVRGIFPYIKQESQDTCFIRQRTYGEFLSDRFGLRPSPGPIVHVNGDIIGEHKGLHLYTVGQRRGINCPAPEPYYVVKLDMGKNRLIVGGKQDLLTRECLVHDINWIVNPPQSSLSVRTRIRYRHRQAASTLTPLDRSHAKIRFNRPQESVTPGQCAVFYQDNEVLGGGWIKPLDEYAEI